ncbi:MAG: hypothetical protein AB7I41_15205 [Candidatus Sericytochromatia bacterium]
MNADNRLAACHQDLNRLIPRWLALPEDEQQWQIQRFIDKLLREPDLLSDFCAALMQRVSQLEIQLVPVDRVDVNRADYVLSRSLWLNLNLLKS